MYNCNAWSEAGNSCDLTAEHNGKHEDYLGGEVGGPQTVTWGWQQDEEPKRGELIAKATVGQIVDIAREMPSGERKALHAAIGAVL